MATSNSTNYTETAQDVIRMAFFHIGKYGNGRTIAAEDYDIASNILNAMIKKWQAQGLHLWAKQEGILYITPYQGEYSLGSYTYFAERSASNTQQLTNALLAGATSIVVGSTSNMTANDHIGIVLDTGYIHWTTIASITNSTTVVINLALTANVSAANLVYSFTSTAVKPLRILSARLIRGYDSGSTTSQIEIPMSVMAYEDYWNLSATTQNSNYPNQFCYMPKVDNGTLYLWPRPNNGAYRVQITYERQLQDLDALDNNFDLPSEWLEALQWQLAVRLCPGYGKSEKLQEIAPIAASMLDSVMNWDNELAYVKFSPEWGY